MKLSVVIPVYNECDTLRALLQRVKDVPIDKEIILIDDFSTDGTRDVLKSLQQEEPSLKIFFHEHNQGKGAALNAISNHWFELFREQGLADENLNDAALVAAMAATPKLIERPIVLANGKAAVGRPPESVLDIL